MFETDDLSITTNAKIVYRNLYGEELTALTQTFPFTVDNSGFTSKCTNARLVFESAAYDEYLAFQGEWEWADLVVYSTLEVKSDTYGCDPVYKLYAFSPYAAPDDGWMDLDSLIELMEDELTSGQLSSWISFNDLSGDFISTYYKPDVEELTTTFTDNDGKTSFKFKVEATLPGSTEDGPSKLSTGALNSAEFEVVVLSQAVVDACVNNKLTIGSRTVKDDTERPDVLEH
jgi:hypothetical protein